MPGLRLHSICMVSLQHHLKHEAVKETWRLYKLPFRRTPLGWIGIISRHSEGPSNVCRAVGPALGGVLWAASVSINIPGHQMLAFGLTGAGFLVPLFIFSNLKLSVLQWAWIQRASHSAAEDIIVLLYNNAVTNGVSWLNQSAILLGQFSLQDVIQSWPHFILLARTCLTAGSQACRIHRVACLFKLHPWWRQQTLLSDMLNIR